MKTLFLIRGIPGAGKSTVASLITDCNVAADDYFDIYLDGIFNPVYLKAAHEWCQDIVDGYMRSEVSKIAVHNTFTQAWEMEAYYNLAKKHGYMVHSLIAENRHGGESVHDVPEDKITQMQSRFEIIL